MGLKNSKTWWRNTWMVPKLASKLFLNWIRYLKLPPAFKTSLGLKLLLFCLKLLLFCHFPHVTKEIERCQIELSKITYSFKILFKLGLKLLLFCRFPHVAKMCMIKIELSKITYSFHMLFKLGLKLLLFAVFPI